MRLCINPRCPRPENPGDRSVCEACGSRLLLRDRYRVTGVLHRGEDRVTTIYDVVDVRNQGDPKVLKVLYTQNRYAISRFNKEADLLKNNQIEGLPKVGSGRYFPIEFPGNSITAYCLVMEKIQGPNLDQWLEKHGPIEEKLAIEWLKQITTILGKLHAKKFIHRDIKPSNIMYSESEERIFLIDLGAVRSIAQNLVDGQTTTTSGNFPYRAPEQSQGKTVPQSDFYALGCTFVHLLTNQNPDRIPKDTQEKLLWRARSTPVSDKFAELIDSLLEFQPEKRPQNTESILKQIQSLENILVRGSQPLSVFQKGSSVILLLIFLSMGYIAITRNDPLPSPDSLNETNCRLRKDGEPDTNALAKDAQKAINAAKSKESTYPIIQQYSNSIVDPKQFGCTVRVEILRKRDEIVLPELALELERVIRENVNDSVKDTIKVEIVPRYTEGIPQT